MKRTITVISVMMMLACPTFAQDSPGSTSEQKKVHEDAGKHAGMLASLPNVTDEQKAALKQIRKEGRKMMKPQHEKLRDLKKKLGNEKLAENPDLKSINSLIDQMHSLEATLDKAKAAQQMKALSVLTPEQRKVLTIKMKEKRANRQQAKKEHEGKHRSE